MLSAFSTSDKKPRMTTNSKEYSLVISGTYGRLSIGLYVGRIPQASVLFAKSPLSQDFVPHIVWFLDDRGLEFSDLAYIALDTGPGAFTTLRVLISTVNALSFATQIPIVACNGLHVVMDELLYNAGFHTKVALLNAYNNEVFYRICDRDDKPIMEDGYAEVSVVAEMLNKLDAPLFVGGNGYTTYKELFDSYIKVPFHVDDAEFATIIGVADQAQRIWKSYESEKDFVYEVQPAYLKEHRYKKIA